MIPLCANSTLEQEAALLATLRHPAIPQVYDFLAEQSGCCLELGFAPGEDLERYLARTGQPVIESLLIHWAVQLLDVLSSLQTQQSQPIMFRDLRPSHINL
jgi:serine/threonine protein kinase